MQDYRLDRFLTLRLFKLFIRRKGPATNRRIPILMYHSISDDKGSSLYPYYHIHTSPSVFAEQMKFLSDHHFTVIDLKDLQNCFETNDKSEKKFAVLTFDDGYRDFYVSAFPILQEHHLPATVFLPTDFIDENRKTFKGKECLTWTEVRELQNKGITFGSHTLSHPELYNLPWEKVRRELHDSKQRIEYELHMPVTSFCYPYAFPQENRAFVLRLKQELIEQGYCLTVTTVIGRANRVSDLLALPRLPVNQSDDEKFFEAKMLGGYDWMVAPQALVRRMKSHRW
jgi:peptidoglycan/xylan/chitin deacetylase (PgdA/CDA1 family)